MKLYALSLLTLVCMSAGLSASYPPHVEDQANIKKTHQNGSFVSDLFRIATGSAFVAGGIYALVQAKDNCQSTKGASGVANRVIGKAKNGWDWLNNRGDEHSQFYNNNEQLLKTGLWGTTGLTSHFVGLKLVLRGLHLTN